MPFQDRIRNQTGQNPGGTCPVPGPALAVLRVSFLPPSPFHFCKSQAELSWDDLQFIRSTNNLFKFPVTMYLLSQLRASGLAMFPVLHIS